MPDQLSEETVEKIVAMLVKLFVENGIDKPTSGIAMIVLLNRLKAEGYEIVMFQQTPSDEVH